MGEKSALMRWNRENTGPRWLWNGLYIIPKNGKMELNNKHWDRRQQYAMKGWAETNLFENMRLWSGSAWYLPTWKSTGHVQARMWDIHGYIYWIYWITGYIQQWCGSDWISPWEAGRLGLESFIQEKGHPRFRSSGFVSCTRSCLVIWDIFPFSILFRLFPLDGRLPRDHNQLSKSRCSTVGYTAVGHCCPPGGQFCQSNESTVAGHMTGRLVTASGYITWLLNWDSLQWLKFKIGSTNKIPILTSVLFFGILQGWGGWRPDFMAQFPFFCWVNSSLDFCWLCMIK